MSYMECAEWCHAMEPNVMSIRSSIDDYDCDMSKYHKN